MSISLTQSYTAIVPGNTSYFAAVGGTSPYTYSVLAGGAGGSIDSSSGLYTAPSAMTAYPVIRLYDTIQVIDAMSDSATAQILVASPLFLFCDIIQKFMGLDNNHVYLYDQKLFQPTDSGLYIIVGIESCRPFGNNISNDGSGSGLDAISYINMWNMLSIDLISRGPAARDLKEYVISALNSTYSQQQQQKNAFLIGRITSGFTNVPNLDGAAIPYRFRASVQFQYTTTITNPVQYFDTFNNPTIVENE